MAVISGVLGGAVTWWRTGRHPDGLAVTALSFAATALWRKSANLPQLNTDGLSMFSANDWAAPMLIFVFLRAYELTRPVALTTQRSGKPPCTPARSPSPSTSSAFKNSEVNNYYITNNRHVVLGCVVTAVRV